MKRHTRSIAAGLIVALAPLLVSVSVGSPAWAQSDEASTKAARARFQEGVQYYDKGQYENARAAFLQAYALRKHPAVLLNLAQSSLKSGHPMEAVKYFQQFLRESTSMTPAQRSDAERGLTEARSKLGRLEISAPTGAEISVDSTSLGAAPLSDAVDVEPGTHMVRAKLSDGTADVKSVTPGPGDKVKVVFSAPEAPAAAAPVPVPAPTTTTPPGGPASSTPSALDTPPSEPIGGTTTPPPAESSGKWSLVPGIVGASIGAAGLGTALAFYFFKQSAQDSADSVANEIRSNGGTQGTCTSTDPNTVTRYGAACSALRDNNDKVDKNATVGNIALGVGIAGAVFGATWLIVAGVHNSKAGKEAAPAPSTGFIRPVPMVLSNAKGLALEGAF
ncbi:hypothetical protein LVJ94_35565 [Pendulispora rubella]|uniref:PEGA domain-containing protein n=1 Tax=Pendulispora rubella TaxID=2741070 RepID=A0ABZ2KUQ0_9BACT